MVVGCAGLARRFVFSLLSLLVLAVAAASASAAGLTVLVDTDNNAATGCTVATANGPFGGVELRFVTTVDTTQNPPRVTGVTQETCTAAPGTFGPPVSVSAGGWPVGVGNGTGGDNVIETGLPLPAGTTLVHIGLTYVDPAIGSDAVTAGVGGGPIIVAVAALGGPLEQVPTLSDAMLVVLVLLVGAVGWRYGRHRLAAPLAVVGLVMVTTLAFAAIVLDGLISDWTAIPPVAIDGADAPPGADISAVFATIEGSTLFVRVDAKTGMPPAAVADNYTAVAGTTLNIPAASGLIANDTRGIPAATVQSFGGGNAGGTVTTNPAGATASFGVGGSLNVTAGGGFTFTPAAGFTGNFTFSYRLANINNTSDATVTISTQSAPAITSPNATSFNIGTAGTFTVTATGVPTPTLSMTGALPAGVTFNAGTGVLSGTPAAGTAGAYPLVFTATNGVGAPATQNFTLTVTQGVTITSAAATTFTVGSAGTFTVTTVSSPVAATITQTGALPAGVSFTNNADGTATLAGTPGAGTGGTYPITITASNGVGSPGVQNFTLTVNQAPAITSANAATFLVGTAGTHTVTATGFPAPTFSVTGALPSGVTLNTTTGVLSGTPAAGTAGSYPLVFTASNGTLPNATQNFTLTVNQGVLITSANNTTFTVGVLGTFTVTTSGTPTASTVTATGALPGGVTYTDNGNGTGTLAGTPGAGTGGTYTLTITASNGVPPNAVQTFTLTVNQAPAITSANATTFTVGTVGSFTVVASGFPAPTYSLTGALPSGVTFNSTTGVLSGPPGAGTGGAYPLTITATNGVGAPAVQAFTLTVNQAPAITSANATTFTVGTLGTFMVTTSGVPSGAAMAIGAVGALPGGVSFVDNGNGTATLAGTPAALSGGTYTLTITANNGIAPNAVQTFTLTVNQAPAITSANTTTFNVGTAGSFSVIATGFPAPTYSVTGALPPLVTFNPATGVLSGTPSAGTAGTYPLTFTAANGVLPDAVQGFTLTVTDSAVAVADAYSVVHDSGVNSVAAPGVLGNDTGTPAPTVTSATGSGAPCAVPCTIATTHGSATVNADGSFTYTPAANYAGPDAFTYIATNVAGSTSATVTLTVTNALPVVDLNGGAAGIDFAATFTEGGGPVAIVDAAQLAVADTDDTQLTGATLVITNPLDGISESLSWTCTGIAPVCEGGIQVADVTYTAATGTLEILATAPLADFQKLLRTIQYANASVAPNGTTRDVTFTVNDGINDNLPIAHSMVAISGVNQAPVVTRPATASTPTNTPLVFAGTVSVADPDAGTANVTVTLTATNGTATLSGTAGLAVTGNGTANVTSTGPIASQNAALNGLSFTPTAAFSGAATLTIAIDDLGNTGSGGPLTDSKSIAITVDDLPSVLSTVPTNGASAVNGASALTVTFSESVNATTASFTLECPVGTPKTYTLSASPATTFTLTPSPALPAGTACRLTVVAAQVTDSIGQNPTANTVVNFTTNTLPTVTSTVPTGGATGVAPTATITINFSESVNATGTAFTLQCPGGTPKTFTASASPAASYTLTPSASLPTGTVCAVNVVAAQITDVDGGQNMAADFPFTFTTGVPPTITSGNAVSATVGSLLNFPVTTTATPTITSLTMASVTPGPGGALPAGVAFNYTSGANGALVGTPTNAAHVGSYVVSFTASNGLAPDAVQNPFTLTLACPAITLAPANGTTFNALYNTAFAQAYTPSGGTAPYTYTIGGFSPPPWLSFSGNNLTGTPPTTGAFGFSVQATDAYGCTSPTQNYTIIVSPVVVNDSYNALGNVLVDSASGPGTPFSVIDNDSFPAGATISAFQNPSANGGTVTMTTSGPNMGRFTYDPFLGFTGTDTFTYTVTSNGASATGTATFNVSGMVWFVKNGAGACVSGCDGNMSHPFQDMSNFNAVNNGLAGHPAANHPIFVYGTGTNYSGNATLLSGQRLIGQGAAGSLVTLGGVTPQNGQTLPTTGGTSPVLGGQLTVGSGNFLHGLTLGGNVALNGTGFGTLTVNDNVSINTASKAISLNNGTLAATFTGVTSSGGTDNVSLSNVATTGTADLGTGSISGTGGFGFTINGGGGSFSYGGSITTAASLGGGAVAILNKTGGTVTLSGDINPAAAAGAITAQLNSGGTITFSGAQKKISNGTAAGVNLVNNTGATINFSGGGLDVATTTGTAFNATGGGTVNVTGSGNVLGSTSGTALNVASTTIGASGLNFRSISSNGGSSTGIILDTTGTSGSLTVSGNSAAGTGGTIANKTGTDGTTNTGIGIYLNNTKSPAFNWMQLNDFQNYAIRGFLVDGFTLDRTVINGTNGTTDVIAATSSPEGSVAFGTGTGENGGPVNGLTGSASITNTSISGGYSDNFRVFNQSGTLNRLTFDTVTIGANSTANGNAGVLVEPQGSAVIKLTVTNSAFTASRGDLLHYVDNGSGAGQDLVISNTSFSNNHPAIATGGGGVTINSGVNNNLVVSITGNTFRDAVGPGVLIVKPTGTGTLAGTFGSNSIGVAAVANSGSAEGSALKVQTVGQGTVTLSITNNSIHQYNNFGIELLAGGGASAQSGAFNTTITGNTIDNPGTTAGTLGIPKNGVHLNIGTVPGDTYLACSVITGNTIFASGADASPPIGFDFDFRLRQRQATTIRLPGYGGSISDNAAVVAFVAANNPAGGTPTGLASNTVPTGGGYTGTGTTCP